MTTTHPRLLDSLFEVSLDTVLDPFVLLRAFRDGRGAVVGFEFVHGNTAACDSIGIGREDLVGRSLDEVVPGHLASGLLARYAEGVEAGEPLALTRHHHEGDVDDRRVAGVFDLRASKVGETISFTWREVTDLEQREGRDRLRARLLDEVDAAVIATGPGFRIDYVNRGAERLFGWGRDEVLGRTTDEVVLGHSPEDARRLAALRTALADGDGRTTELTLVRPDGGTLNVMVRSVPRVEDVEPSGAVSIIVDIGRLKAAERDAAESSEFLTALTDNMAEGMFAVDKDGLLTFLNQAGAQALGWSKTELLGTNMHEATHFERVDGSAYPLADCPLTRTQTTGESARVVYDVFTCRDGTRLPVSYNASPLRSSGGHGDGVRGAVTVFNDISDRLADERRVERELDKLAWVGRIRDALDQDRFVLYAQPIMDLRTGEVTQHELLLRMLSTTGDIIPPDKFLPTAEEFGLIRRIDDWVIGQSALLAAAGHHVEFNLSGKSVTSPDMADRIVETLLRAGAPPENIVCEITETALMDDLAAGDAFVKALTSSGCKVALDDFGTGYAGFAYLKRLPVAYLKIDKQFVQDLVQDDANRHVIKAVVNLAQGFGLETVAEGAEDEETVSILQELELDFVQGYVIGRPAPIDEAAMRSMSTKRRAL